MLALHFSQSFLKSFSVNIALCAALNDALEEYYIVDRNAALKLRYDQFSPYCFAEFIISDSIEVLFFELYFGLF